MGHLISLFEDLEETPPAGEAKMDGEEAQMQELTGSYSRSLRPFSQLKDLGIPRREYIQGDWFKEGDLGFIYAPRGLGKTWLSLAIGTSVARGVPCGPWVAHAPRKVLYVDGEMPCESLESRLAGLGANDNIAVLSHEALFHLEGRVLNLAERPSQDALTNVLRRDGIQVLILDNLSCLISGVAENEADSWQGVLDWLLTLRRYKIAVIVVHHAGRNGQTMRGTSRREDAAFWVIRLDPTEGDERGGAQFISRFTKDRNSPAEQPSYLWRFHTDTHGLVQIETLLASNMEVFRGWIEDGLTSAEDIAREMGVSKGTVSKLARRAMGEGWLRKEGREYVLV